MVGVTSTAHPLPAPAARKRRGFPLIVWLVLGVSFLVFTPMTLISLRSEALSVQDGPALVVDLVADGMRFLPDEIRVPRDANVRVNFINRDQSGTPHDFQTTKQRRDVRVVVWPGENRPIVFKAASQPGRYAFICTIRGHSQAGMAGVIVVE